MPNTYYYTRLTAEQKATYKTVSAGLGAYAEEIDVTPIASDEMSLVFNYITLDNPLMFQAVSFTQMSYPGRKCVIKPDYKFPQDLAKSYAEKVLAYLRIFDTAKTMSDADKELYVHDYCLKNFTYDHTRGEQANSVLGLVLYGTAVCEGIAKFVNLALDYLGVKCLVVTGDGINPSNGTTEAHAWNIVKLERQTYHLDVTFDLGISGNSLRYDYFNLSDNDIKKDHIITSDVPECTTTGSDYYSLNAQVVGGPKNLKSYIDNSLKQGKKNIIFRISKADGIDDISNRVMQIASKSLGRIIRGYSTIEMGFNKGQMVFELTFR